MTNIDKNSNSKQLDSQKLSNFTVFRVDHDKDNPFVMVSKKFLFAETQHKTPELSLKSKGFLVIVLSLVSTWTFNISGMTKITGESKSSIYKILSELEKKGYCRREQYKEAGKFASIKYYFYETPINTRTLPFLKNGETVNLPHTENGETVNNIETPINTRTLPFLNLPHTVKQSQLNNDNNRINISSSKEDNNMFSTHQEICDYFNSTCINLCQVLEVTDERESSINILIDKYGIEKIKKAINEVAISDFLNEKTEKAFKASFDWFIKPNNFLKVLEGSYRNFQKSSTTEHGLSKAMRR